MPITLPTKPVPDPTTRQQLASEGIYVYDNTMLREFERCPYAFHKKFELNLRPLSDAPNTPLLFGQCIHSALEAWAPDHDVDLMLETFEQCFSPYEEQPTIGKSGKLLAATYSLIFGLALLEAYHRKYDSDQRTLVGNELPLCEEIADGVFVMGLLDKLYQSSDGRLTFLDHKTSKYYKTFDLNPNPQFMGYKVLCEKLTGQRVEGELDMLGVAKSTDVDQLLRREPFDYSHDQLERWRQATLQLVAEINQCRASGTWPRRWNCRPYFHDCMFKPLCVSPTDASIETLISRLYKVEVWDPLQVKD